MVWQSVATLIGKPKVGKILRERQTLQPLAQSRQQRRRPPQPSYDLLCGWQPPLPPSPPGGLLRKQHPQTAFSAVTCVHEKRCPSQVVHWPRYSAAALLTLPPPHSLIRSKHPLKLSGRSNIHNRIPQPSCAATSTEPSNLSGRLVASSAAAAQTHPFRSESPTAVLANHDGRSPLPSLLRTTPCPQKRHTLRQSCALVCGGGLRFCFPFLPRPGRRRHPPQPSAQISLQR